MSQEYEHLTAHEIAFRVVERTARPQSPRETLLSIQSSEEGLLLTVVGGAAPNPGHAIDVTSVSLVGTANDEGSFIRVLARVTPPPEGRLFPQMVVFPSITLAIDEAFVGCPVKIVWS